MSAGTLLTLFVVPAVYSYLGRRQVKLTDVGEPAMQPGE
jgi:hypothetical protein